MKMNEAEKMAGEWINMHIEAGGADLQGEMVLIERLIHQVAERTREECEKAATFELAPHPRWSMQVGDAIRAARWEYEKVVKGIENESNTR